MRSARLARARSPRASSISTVAYYGAVVFIVASTVSGAISIGRLTFLIGSFQRSRGLISGLLGGITRSYEQGLQLKDLFDFLAVEPRIRNVDDPKPLFETRRH